MEGSKNTTTRDFFNNSPHLDDDDDDESVCSDLTDFSFLSSSKSTRPRTFSSATSLMTHSWARSIADAEYCWGKSGALLVKAWSPSSCTHWCCDRAISLPNWCCDRAISLPNWCCDRAISIPKHGRGNLIPHHGRGNLIPHHGRGNSIPYHGRGNSTPRHGPCNSSPQQHQSGDTNSVPHQLQGEATYGPSHHSGDKTFGHNNEGAHSNPHIVEGRTSAIYYSSGHGTSSTHNSSGRSDFNPWHCRRLTESAQKQDLENNSFFSCHKRERTAYSPYTSEERRASIHHQPGRKTVVPQYSWGQNKSAVRYCSDNNTPIQSRDRECGHSRPRSYERNSSPFSQHSGGRTSVTLQDWRRPRNAAKDAADFRTSNSCHNSELTHHSFHTFNGRLACIHPCCGTTCPALKPAWKVAASVPRHHWRSTTSAPCHQCGYPHSNHHSSWDSHLKSDPSSYVACDELQPGHTTRLMHASLKPRYHILFANDVDNRKLGFLPVFSSGDNGPSHKHHDRRTVWVGEKSFIAKELTWMVSGYICDHVPSEVRPGQCLHLEQGLDLWKSSFIETWAPVWVGYDEIEDYQPYGKEHLGKKVEVLGKLDYESTSKMTSEMRKLFEPRPMFDIVFEHDLQRLRWDAWLNEK